MASGILPIYPYAVDDFGNADGAEEAAVAALDPFTLRVTPAAGSLISIDESPSPGSLHFTDALLGMPRTDVPFTLPAQARTFVYCNASGIPPDGSLASAFDDFQAAIGNDGGTNSLGADAGAPILAISGTIPLSDIVEINAARPIILGGFAMDGTRSQGATSSVELEMLDIINVNSAGTRIEGLQFGFPVEHGGSIEIPVGSTYFINVSASASFIGCSLRTPPIIVATSQTGTTTFTFFRIGNAVTSFDRCSIVGDGVVFSGTGTGQVFAMHRPDGATAELLITNSLICPGTILTSTSANHEMTGIRAYQSNSTLNIVGSTITGGMGTVGDGLPRMKAISMNSSSNTHLYLHNSTLLAQDLSNPESVLLELSGAAPATDSVFRQVAYGYANNTDRLINYAGTIIITTTWAPAEKYCAESHRGPLEKLGYSSLVATNTDFLKLSAASPSFLKSGGLDFGLNGNPLVGPLKVFSNERLSLDRDGRARTGNGSTGYSSGAFEAD